MTVLVTVSPCLACGVMWLLSSQLGRSVGPPLLQLHLDLLRLLVVHCAHLDAQNQQRCEAAQAESDLFLDMESMASLELANDKVPPPFLCASSFFFESPRCGFCLHFSLKTSLWLSSENRKGKKL